MVSTIATYIFRAKWYLFSLPNCIIIIKVKQNSLVTLIMRSQCVKQITFGSWKNTFWILNKVPYSEQGVIYDKRVTSYYLRKRINDHLCHLINMLWMRVEIFMWVNISRTSTWIFMVISVNLSSKILTVWGKNETVNVMRVMKPLVGRPNGASPNKRTFRYQHQRCLHHGWTEIKDFPF